MMDRYGQTVDEFQIILETFLINNSQDKLRIDGFGKFEQYLHQENKVGGDPFPLCQFITLANYNFSRNQLHWENDHCKMLQKTQHLKKYPSRKQVA